MTGAAESSFVAKRPWPVVPPSQPDESLSSWLDRIGREYGLDGEALLRSGGFEEIGAGVDVDRAPPDDLVEWLSWKTEQSPHRLRAMTLSGYAPSLLDGVAPPAATLTVYVRQTRLISRPEERIVVAEAVPWIDVRWIGMWGCTACLKTDETPYRRLHWRLPWMLTCPLHSRFLEQIVLFPDSRWIIVEGQSFGRVPLEAELLHLDHMTHQAVTRGRVNTSDGQIAGGTWVRLLRAVIEELARFPPDDTPRGQGIAELWADLGVKPPTVNMSTGPYEALSPKLKLRFMRGAALAVKRSQSLLTDWMEGNGSAMLDYEADVSRRLWNRC